MYRPRLCCRGMISLDRGHEGLLKLGLTAQIR